MDNEQTTQAPATAPEREAAIVGSARETATRVADTARRATGQVADAAADVADRMSAQANDALGRALRYTSEHPMQALAAVLVAGFLFGRLSRRD